MNPSIMIVPVIADLQFFVRNLERHARSVIGQPSAFQEYFDFKQIGHAW
jgi:hypothetical protein